jgi:hypothetical protein
VLVAGAAGRVGRCATSRLSVCCTWRNGKAGVSAWKRVCYQVYHLDCSSRQTAAKQRYLPA